VLFAGDLLFHQVTPLVFMGSVEGALRALDWIAAFEPAHVVPGHGPLIDAAALPDVLETHRRHYGLILDTARRGRRDGLAPLDAARRCVLDTFAGLPDSERVVLNLHRAYADALGIEMNLMAALAGARRPEQRAHAHVGLTRRRSRLIDRRANQALLVAYKAPTSVSQDWTTAMSTR
jgi:cyclase